MSGEGTQDLVDRLVALGIEPREAKLYVHLTLRGPMRASEAAAAVRLKRTETYRALEALARRGFVTPRLARPVVYEAVSPEALFAELLATHDARRTEMERLRERVARLATAAREGRDRPSGRYGYKIVQGRRAILGAVETALRQARASYAIVSSVFDVPNAGPQSRAYQTMLARAELGLPMRVLLRDAPGVDRVVAPLTTMPNVHVRVFEPAHAVRFAIVDGREVVCWLVSDAAPGVDARDDVAMWTNAPDFIAAQQTLFEALWARGRETVRAASRN